MDATGSGGSGKPKASSRAQHEASVRALFRRRRAIALTVILAFIALTWWAYCTYASGRVVLYQQATASSITRGFAFGPFYAPAKQNCVYTYHINIPAAAGMWETRTEILDSNGVVIHPQTDLILVGANAFGSSTRYSRSCRFVLRDSGMYYLKFTQVNGDYSGQVGSSTDKPVMTMWVRAGALRGLEEWLPIALIVLLIIALWFLI